MLFHSFHSQAVQSLLFPCFFGTFFLKVISLRYYCYWCCCCFCCSCLDNQIVRFVVMIWAHVYTIFKSYKITSLLMRMLCLSDLWMVCFNERQWIHLIRIFLASLYWFNVPIAIVYALNTFFQCLFWYEYKLSLMYVCMCFYVGPSWRLSKFHIRTTNLEFQWFLVQSYNTKNMYGTEFTWTTIHTMTYSWIQTHTHTRARKRRQTNDEIFQGTTTITTTAKTSTSTNANSRFWNNLAGRSLWSSSMIACVCVCFCI